MPRPETAYSHNENTPLPLSVVEHKPGRTSVSIWKALCAVGLGNCGNNLYSRKDEYITEWFHFILMGHSMDSRD